MVGSVTGLPAGSLPHTVGIYLDNHASQNTLSGNVVTGAEYGIQLHDASNNLVSDNLLYGNRVHQLWMQEGANIVSPGGDIFGNSVNNNQFLALDTGFAVRLTSTIGSSAHFGSFSGNHYSALLSPFILSEVTSTGVETRHTLATWQAAGRESLARATEPVGYAAYLASGPNIVPNGNLASGLNGWTWWNQSVPYAQAAAASCAGANCISLTAGASPSLLSSPNFSVVANQWYRLTVDAVTSTPGQPISLLVRRGGGIRGSAAENNYDSVMGGGVTFIGNTTLQRYSTIFRATSTVNAADPVTGDKGARVDFERVQPGTQLGVTRVELVPLQQAAAALKIRLAQNNKHIADMVSCPAADQIAGLCPKFVYFENDVPVAWPAFIEAISAKALYSRETTLVDTDRDGVADQQDACPATPVGLAVNSAGCALGQ